MAGIPGDSRDHVTDRGRHSRRSGVGFYRDVLFLVAGILIVGAIVFGGLSMLAGRDSSSTTSTSTTTMDPDSTTTSLGNASTSLSVRPSSTTTSASTPTTDTSAPATTIRPLRPPTEVQVVVLNSTTRTGLAAGITEELAALGYQMSEPTNYTPELSDTMIFHAEGFSLEALEVMQAVGEGTVAANQELAEDQGVDVVVVIGLSHQE